MNTFLSSPGLSVKSVMQLKERTPSHVGCVGQYNSMSGKILGRGGANPKGRGGPVCFLGSPETRALTPGGVFSKNSLASIAFSVFGSLAIECQHARRKSDVLF